jgi:hypothetical protein
MRESIEDYAIEVLNACIPGGVQKSGWKDKVRELVVGEEEADEDWHEMFTSLLLVPDGWRWFEDERVLVFFEVEDTSPITRTKLQKRVDLLWLLDAVYITLQVEIVSRYGNHKETLRLLPHWVAIQQEK